MGSMAFAADGPAILKDLHREHPRLFWHKDDVGRLRERIKAEPVLRQWHQGLVQRAERMLTEKPVEHKLDGPRLLGQSRAALGRISTLAGLYLLDGDVRFAERAKKEMFTAGAFNDWNPSHFLDVAEMTNALAIGYDWLFDYLTPEERKTIREAMIRNGLKPGLDGFTAAKPAWWTRAEHNWSQVCNGGLTVGALAIAEDEPQLAADLIERCRVAIKPSMHAFAPDGGFGEGPGYWGYATAYNVYYLAALQTALGTDFGLKQEPGFDVTGYFRMHVTGPIGRSLNYADAGDRAGSAPQMFWLAEAFNHPEFARHELQMAGDSGSIFHLIYLNRQSTTVDGQSTTPLDAVFRGVHAAFFRSAWYDPNALFAGIKGGDNRTNHSHLDLGGFVLDAMGKRWAVDLGGDNYNLPAYFGNKRWTYYRLRTESHNTITLDGENQRPDGKAPIARFLSTPQRAHVVIDQTHGYRDQAKKMLRGLAMIDRSAILVQDEIEAKQPSDIRWNFLTPAKVNIDGQTATLTQDQASIQVRILAPADATFEILSANPPPPQKQQPDVKNLTVRLPQKSSSARIAVLIVPAGSKAAAVNVEPLETWGGK